MARRTIPATWQDFDGMRGEKSTFIHAFSEYIDNSVSSYQTKNKNSVDGLKITIDIVTNENDEQFFTVIDNAAGMDDETLYQAIIPNNKKGKSDTKLNQHGIGMKLATFWFGRSLKIITKNKKNKQFQLLIDINDENLYDNAEVDIIKNNDDVFNVDGVEYETGTYIKVWNIRTKPSRVLQNSEMDGIMKGLGWRYADLLKDMIVLISFTSSSGKKQQYKVDPFHVEPYVLSDAKEGLARKSNINFDSLKYEKVVGLQIQKIYSKNKDDIDVITGGVNFYDQWKNNKPLQFDYVTRIENSNVKVTWGIIALNQTELNDPYGYSQLTGFTLLNNGRAIMHGPNIINYEKQRNIIPIETFPFLKKEATSKEHIYRRLYGVIDLTGVEEADRNKSVFNWGVSGKDDISLIAQEIFKTMKEILNVMMNAENNPTIIKKISINKPSIIRKVDDIIHELPALDQFVTLERGGECSMNFGNTIIIFKIKHVTTDAKRALQVKTINHNEIVEIYLNDQHYLWRDLLNKNDASSAELKGKFIYPLAVAYAICKIQFDNKSVPLYSDMLPQKIKEMSFDDFFNTVLKKFQYKNNANT